MVNHEKHHEAILLRKQGRSYNQIQKMLTVSKGSLSRWLHDIKLTPDQISKLASRELKIESFRKTMEKKRLARLDNTYQKALDMLIPVSPKELFIAGLFLYWGEGRKGLQSPVSLNNTDPQVMKFYLYWLIKACSVPKRKIRVALHLYRNMDIQSEINYWSSMLNLPTSQFVNPYIKETSSVKIKHLGFGHGTCGLYFSDVQLKERIMMSIKVIAENGYLTDR